MVSEGNKGVALVKQNYFTIAIFACIILAEVAPWIGSRGG